jgi:hypothetical protein
MGIPGIGKQGGVSGLGNLGSEVGALSDIPESLMEGAKNRVLKRLRLWGVSAGESRIPYTDGEGRDAVDLGLAEEDAESEEWFELSDRADKADFWRWWYMKSKRVRVEIEKLMFVQTTRWIYLPYFRHLRQVQIHVFEVLKQPSQIVIRGHWYRALDETC